MGWGGQTGYGTTTIPMQQKILRHACGGIQQQESSIPAGFLESIWGQNAKGAKGSSKGTLSTAPPRTRKSNIQLGISGQRPPPSRRGNMVQRTPEWGPGGPGKGPGTFATPGQPAPWKGGPPPTSGWGGSTGGTGPGQMKMGGGGFGGGATNMSTGGGSPYTGAGSGGGGGAGIGGFVTPMNQWTPGMQGKYNWQGGDPARRAQLSQIDWSGAGAQSHEQKAQMMQEFMRTGVVPGGGGAGGGGGGAGGGGDSTLQGNLNAMSGAGQGLLEPGSDYYQRLSQAMQQQIGAQSAAQQRSAALRGAQSGLGAGASPEMMMTTGDIAQGGLEAQGAAESGLALQAPQLGASMLSSTFNPMLGMQQLAEGSRQFNQGFGENQRQFGVNTAMQQQQMAQQQAWQQAQLQAQQQAQQQEAMMRQYSMMFGMF